MDESDVWRRSHGRHSSVKNRWPHEADESKTGEVPIENESWLQSLGRRSSVKSRWPHEESNSDLQDGSKQEQSYHHTKSKTGEVSSGTGRNVRTIPGTTRPKTTSHMQDISQSPPVVTPTPAPRMQSKSRETGALKHKAGHKEGRHKSEGASTTPTSPIVGFPSPVAVGNHSQPANMAGNGAIMSMPAAGQEGVEKQNEWAHYDPGAVYSNVEVYTQPANMASNGATTSVGQEGGEKLDELANFDPGAVYTNIEVIQGHLQPDLEDEYENSPMGVKNGYKEEHQEHEEVWQSASFRPPKPRPRMKDSSLGSSTDNRHSLDPPTDVAELQQLLREKDAQIEQMSQQLHKTAADLTKSVRHKREQNLIIEDLREQLARKEKPSTGKDASTRHDNDQLKVIEQLKKRNAQLDFQMRQLQGKMHRERSSASSQEQKAPHASQELAQSQKYVTQLTTEVEQLRREKADLVGEVKTHKSSLAEKDDLLKTALDDQLHLQQQTHERDSLIQSLQNKNEELKRQVSLLCEQVEDLQSQKSQETHEADFWEVPREQVNCNMQKILGIGAWGYVVEGIFRGQQVAVKCLHDMIRSPKFAEVMRKEIAIMAQVRHPNLVLLIAAVIDTENDPLIVTELLDISLRNAYEKKRLQGSSKLSIFRNIAAALNYLHLHHCGEIIHRDVSSSNVLLEAKPNNQWKAKLSDFGSAKLAMEAKTTAPGAFVYAAPEVKREMGIPQTAKIDVYSYGVLLCEVTEERFPDEESIPSMMKVIRDKWASMHRLINSCIQNRPDRRPTMSYILSELNKL